MTKAWIERFSLAGKRALVTGASKGIGYEACKVLADAGADIVATGRDRDGLAAISAEVEELGRRCVVVTADLSKPDGPDQAADAALAAFDGIDILVNNAGIALLDPLLSLTGDDWDTTMAVNLRAPFLLARKLVPGMIARGFGKIINISSQAGVVGIANHGAYCASKGGLNLLTRVMAVEWGKHNIQSNAICPNVILTPMGKRVWSAPEKRDPQIAATPLRRFGKPVEVADMILYLASSASDFVCGEALLIDGGFTAA
jgi:NAD(P)-dependent dehydrogenase (short-subunit alcohol dehydrogenase family)